MPNERHVIEDDEQTYKNALKALKTKYFMQYSTMIKTEPVELLSNDQLVSSTPGFITQKKDGVTKKGTSI